MKKMAIVMGVIVVVAIIFGGIWTQTMLFKIDYPIGVYFDSLSLEITLNGPEWSDGYVNYYKNIPYTKAKNTSVIVDISLVEWKIVEETLFQVVYVVRSRDMPKYTGVGGDYVIVTLLPNHEAILDLDAYKIRGRWECP